MPRNSEVRLNGQICAVVCNNDNSGRYRKLNTYQSVACFAVWSVRPLQGFNIAAEQVRPATYLGTYISHNMVHGTPHSPTQI